MKAFIFDLDGTLIDSEDLMIESLNYALKPHDIPVDRPLLEELRKAKTSALFDYFKLSKEDEKEAYDRLKEHIVENANKIQVIPEIFKLLDLLLEKGKILAIWTARDAKSAELVTKATGLDKYFEFIQTNDELKENKPSPEGLISVAKNLSLQPSEIVMIGDHDHDILAGNSFNCKTIWANWCDTCPNTITAKPDLECKKVEDLINILF